MKMIYRLARLVFGTLYPAYASYKAVKTKNVKEYVKWMMYWIVFALFTCTETITDIFLSWFPFYYEIKIILVIWLLSPATKGSSILYRKFVHPMLSSREQEIDDYISKAKEQSYRQVLDLGQKGVTVLMQTAIKGGGGIVNQLKKSYSLSDLSDPTNDGNDEADDVLVTDPRLMRRRKPGRSPHRSSSASSASVYFSEVDVMTTGAVEGGRVTEVRSIEDISSGYSSGEGLYAQHPLKLQSRDSIASQRTSSLTRARSVRVTRSNASKKPGGNSDDSDENEVFDTNIIFLNDKMKKIDKLSEQKRDSSSSETEFFDIPDSFQLHGKRFDNKQRFSSNNIDSDRNEVHDNNPVKLPKDSFSSDAKPPGIIGYAAEDSKVTACTSDSSSLSFNLTKLSTALSSLYPFSVACASESKTADNVESNIEAAAMDLNRLTHVVKNTEIKQNLPESMNLEINYHKPDMIRKVQDISEVLHNKQSASKSLSIGHIKNEADATSPSSLLSKIANTESCLKADFLTGHTGHENVDTSSTSGTKCVSDHSESKSETRGGKYKKKLAPLPPLPPKKEIASAHPIKATLVLQPGVVRSLSRSAESLNKEIFLNYSPKVRRRSRNKSPAASSSRSSDSSASSKMGQALNKMLKLPKKVAHLNLPGKVKEKRNSWGEFFHARELEGSKIQSKSVSNLDKSLEADKMQETVKTIQRTGSQVSLRSLSESPLAHRRLKIIRRYVDNDID